MHRVLFAYTSHETSSVVEGYGPMPSACLFEDEHTGRRWLLADAPITLHSWVEAESFGALGMVRTSPLRYVAAEHVAEHREVKAGNVEVPERWWINHTGPLLPSMPLLAAGLIVPKSRFANLHVHSEFCLAPETMVVTSGMVWKPIGDVVVGESLVGFDEDLRSPEGSPGRSGSKMRPSAVIASKRVVRDCYRISLADGSSIVASAQHGWVANGTTLGSLIEPGGPPSGYGTGTRRWVTTQELAAAKSPRLIRWARPWLPLDPEHERLAGWLAGLADGEGWLHNGQFCLGQNPGPVMDEILRACRVLGYSTTDLRQQSRKGTCQTFRLAGYETALRFLSQCDPVRFRGRWDEVWVGRRAGSRYSPPVPVVSVDHLGDMETVALTTSTKTFVAEGFLSHNSPLDGLATIEELVDAAVADEQEFISVTDHGYCAAHPQLAKIAKAAGIKPIFGIEANLVNNRFERETETVLRLDGSARQRAHYWHFIMLAMNDIGLRNLWAASSEAHITGFWGRPRMDWSTLEKHNEGIIASTACLRGPVASLILSGDIEGAAMMLARLRTIFPDRLYVELHANHLPDQIIVNRALVELAASLSLPTIVVADSHYACRDEQDLHQVWIAVQTDKDLDDDQELFAGGQHYHVHSTADIEHSLDYLPKAVVEEAMRNTIEIGTMCTAEIRPRSAMPVFHRHDVKGSTLGSGVERDVEVLRQKVEEGFAAKVAHKENVSVYRDQVERELDLMVSKGFAGYFLIVDDYCLAARSGRAHPQGKKILMGPGRGSVVGSLVAYLLGITKIDPIEADLMFERFLTPGRTSPPDIDLDFPSSERDSITGYTINRWGEDRVVRVGTHGRLKNKGVIQKVAKALGSRITVDFMDLKEISRIITAAEAHTAGAGLKWDELWEQEGDLLEPYRQKYPEIFEVSDKLVKRLASYGRHASGIVIDPEESIVDRLPLRTAGSEKEGRQIVTEFDFEWLEFLGFLKFDFLTLRTLDTIQQCVDLIADDRALPGISIDIDSWVDEYEDPQVWDMLCEGDTLGVFQIETSEGSKLVRRMQPRSIADLSAILTLVRPGPMRSGLTDSYLRRRFGQEEIVATLPEMEAVLGRTYLCMIYQEDIMGVCQALAGYDLAEADKVRAILGKKKVEEAKKEGRRFIERCKERGLDEATVEHIWSQMEEFAKYCVTGDTKIMLAGAGQNSDGWMDVADAYRRLHVDPPSPWRAKFRARKKGVFGMAVHPDGRIRKCRILDVQPAGMQRVVKIVLENGMSITATPDHRHLTPEGLRCVDDGLAVGDMLIVNGGYERDSYTPERDRTTVGERVSEGAINSAFGDDNYGYINGGFASLSAWTAQTPKVCAECGHDGSERRIERAHLDGDRQNNEWSNLRMLCSSCHKKFDYEHNGRRRRGEKGLLSSESRIVSISDEGVQMTYDVMMDEPHVWIANGIATTNTFNRAHAWSYAVLAYWTAWLKCHFPAHFLVAVLSTVDKARIPEFVELARRNGFSVSAPDVNDSQIGFSVSSDRLGVRYGFSSIPDIGTAAANAIIESQPYASWDDFVSRRGPACNWGHIKKLAAVGTFDSILPVGQHRAALERLIEQMAEGKAITCVHKRPGYEGPNGLPCAFPWETEVTIGKSGKPLKQRPLPKTCSRACRQYHEQETYTWPRVDPLSEREVRERERAALGVYLSSTPFDIVSTEYLDAESILYGFEAESAPAGNHVVFGMVQSIRKHVDRSGNQMAFLRVNSRGYELDLTCFSKTWFQIEHLVSRDVLALFEINRNARGSTISNFYPIPV